jgi:hypothetical protein
VKPFLGDQLGRDEGFDDEVDFAPENDEPKMNCWLEVECDTPDGEEAVYYMFVQGDYVRDHVFVDFCEGGHFYRYGFFAEDQIVIEDEMSLVDRFCTGIHEIHERYRMKYLGWNYEKAHDSACVIERIIRRMLLEKGVVIPHSEDIAKIFSLEGSGECCEDAVKELLDDHTDLIKKANKQCNNFVGFREG